MPSYCEDTDYQLGLSPTGVIPLSKLRLPEPDQVVYRPAAIYYVRSNFTRVSDGYVSTEWIWDTMSIGRLSKLLSFLAGEDYANVYLVTDKRDGTYPNPKVSFGMFSAIMWKPILSGDEGIHVAQSPYVVQTIKINFVHMVELSGYL